MKRHVLLIACLLLSCGAEVQVEGGADELLTSEGALASISRITFGDGSTGEKVKTIPPDAASFGLRVHGQKLPYTNPSVISVVFRKRGKTTEVLRLPVEGRLSSVSTSDRLIMNLPLRDVAAGQYDVGVLIGQQLSPLLPLTVVRPEDPPSANGAQCLTPATSRKLFHFEVLQANPATKELVGRFFDDVGCRDVFFLCGDVRLGGLSDAQKEYWIGTICEMYDLGDNTFRIRLTDGKETAWSAAMSMNPPWTYFGKTPYVWAQLDCDPKLACGGFKLP